jgi:DNA-binding protein HU-beta
MNYKELLVATAASSGESQANVDKVIKAMAEVVGKTLKTADEVTIAGLAKIKAKNKPATQGKNPSTGQAITIPARRAITFTTLKPLKDAVN